MEFKDDGKGSKDDSMQLAKQQPIQLETGETVGEQRPSGVMSPRKKLN